MSRGEVVYGHRRSDQDCAWNKFTIMQTLKRLLKLMQYVFLYLIFHKSARKHEHTCTKHTNLSINILHFIRQVKVILDLENLLLLLC